jgi:hypothetical protein
VLCEEQKKQVMSHAASPINITDSDSLLPGRNSLSEGKGGHCSCIGWRTLNQMKVFAAEHRPPWWLQTMKPELACQSAPITKKTGECLCAKTDTIGLQAPGRCQ